MKIMNIKKFVLKNPLLTLSLIVLKLIVLAIVYHFFFSSNAYNTEPYCTYAQPPSSYFPMLVLTGQNKVGGGPLHTIVNNPLADSSSKLGGNLEAAEKLYDFSSQYYYYMNYDPSLYPGYSITDTSFIDVSGYHIDLSSSYLTLTITDTTEGTPNVTPKGDYLIEFYKNDKDCRSPNAHIYNFNRNNSPKSATIVFNNPACDDTFSLTIKPIHTHTNGYRHVGDVFPEQFTIDITFHINPNNTVTWTKKNTGPPLNVPSLAMNTSYAYSKPAFDQSTDGKILITPNLVIDRVGYITDTDDNEIGYVRNDIFDNNHWMLIFKHQNVLESITVNWKTGTPSMSPSTPGGICA